MEWTGARYADQPTVEVSIEIAAPPARIWPLVADITLMPAFSEELQSVEWVAAGATPRVGAQFVGRSKHPSLGEWQTTSTVVEYEPEQRFAWAVEDVANPTATWRFTLAAGNGETTLTQWMRLGPARSGLSFAIDAMPDKEQKIVFVRLREFEQSMQRTLEAIKTLAERATD